MAFLYPWGNTQQLNLDWILQKIKELEAGSGGADLDEVANALISASYAVQAYDRSDIVFRDGKLYRANQAIPAPGEAWTPAHWDEILLGDTVSNLVQYVAALSNDQIANSSSVSGVHTSDALDTLKNAIDGISLDSDSVSNESQVAGTNVTDALDTLNGAISAITPLDTVPTNGSAKGITSGAVYDAVHNRTLLWENTAANWGTTDITLSSSDYDVLEIQFNITNGANDPSIIQRFPKHSGNICLTWVSVDLSTNKSLYDSFFAQRTLTYVNATTFTPTLGVLMRFATSEAPQTLAPYISNGQQYFIIPKKIWGIKY